MKLLFDECVTRYLNSDFVGHEVATVDDAGLKGLRNGALLRAASWRFDVLITVDRNIPFQQNVGALQIAVMILVARTNRYEDLKVLVPKALEALTTIKCGDIVYIP
jgi:hypothetical protein